MNLCWFDKKQKTKTLDEIINEARLEYALGRHTTHKTAKSLIAALRA